MVWKGRPDVIGGDTIDAESTVSTNIELLSVVALLTDRPERGLVRGQVGTVIESVAPGVYEVEFSDDSGRTYASLAIQGDELILLHHHPSRQVA
jgi:hypothetical protein